MGQCHKIVDISFGQSIPGWTQLQNSGVKYDSGESIPKPISSNIQICLLKGGLTKLNAVLYSTI